MRKITLFVFIYTILLLPVFSESNLSLIVTEDLYLSSEEDYMPHYLESNKWGLVQTDDLQSLTYVDVNYNKELRENLILDLGGVIGFNLNDESELFYNELYAQLNYYSLYFVVGKKYSTMGETPSSLSSGSMTISDNASPIPKVSLGFDEFVTIPYTFDLISIKGNISHGWFEGDRYVEDILLHEKSLYVKVDSKIGLYPYGGLVHEAMWGGTFTEGTYEGESLSDISFENFMKIFFADSGDSDSIIEGEQINKLGNHLGAWEFGLYGEYDLLDFQFYYQHYFEDGSGMEFQNNYDGLWGITVSPKNITFIDNILFEFLTTKYQSGDTHNIGDEVLGGRDSYYYHYIYLNGWTHLNSVIGNSFFSTTGEDSSLRIANNRMNVFNVGIEGSIFNDYIYKFQVAYGEYFTAYASTSLYEEGDYMWNLYGELTKQNLFLDNLDVTAGLAYDFGTIEDTFGCVISFSWTL